MRKVYHMVYFIVTEVGGSSPYARGLLTDGEGGTVVGRIIPACPRMRGVYIRNPIASFTYMGSSPLARGLLATTVRSVTSPRIIPARAGFTRTAKVKTPWSGDHPRSRGVYYRRAYSRRRAGGSSPLARGLHERQCRAAYYARIIPARAGFTNQRQDPGCATQDHPRSRGVYTRSWLRNACVIGSSPLARGLLDEDLLAQAGQWIIPARAGFTAAVLSARRRARDHPRSRGVYTGGAGTVMGRTGSSPLARGLRSCRVLWRLRRGIIPARAGFTYWCDYRRYPYSDHPRSRGVYEVWRRSQTVPKGSSPLARGLLS